MPKSGLRTEEIAKKAKLYDLYLDNYALLSLTTHSAVRDLEFHLSDDGSGQSSRLAWGPGNASREEFDLLLFQLAEYLVLALLSANAIFQLGIEEEAQRFYRRYRELAGDL